MSIIILIKKKFDAKKQDKKSFINSFLNPFEHGFVGIFDVTHKNQKQKKNLFSYHRN